MLSIVLPCFNEELNIEPVIRSTAGWLQSRNQPFEIIAVDDGSRDKTGEQLRKISREIPSLRIVTHETNCGYGVAVRSGCDAAHGEIIGFMDSDGQFEANEFDLLLPHLQSFPFVTGRRIRRADPLLRRLFGKLLGIMNILVLNLWVRDINCGLKVFRREIWPGIRPIHGVEKLFNTEVFLNLKRKKIPWHQVPVPHYPRKSGKQTGGSARVIFRMFGELWGLKVAQQ